MEGNYANNSHAHKPEKGKGSYDRNKDVTRLAWTEEEEEAFKELEKKDEQSNCMWK